jgi:hypothetical protein
MEQLKAENEFRATVKNSYNLIKRDSDRIPNPSQLNDKNKGDWIEHKPEQFHQLFDGLLDYCADEDCYDNLDWNSVNYKLYAPDYYEERFPGFAPEVYEILSKSTEEENKVVDHRVPNLRIRREEVTVTFD